MGDKLKTVKVNVLGEEFAITTDLTEDMIKEITRNLEEKIHEIGKNIKNQTKTRMAVMAAFDTMGELFELKSALEEKEKLLLSIEKRTETLVKKIEGCLA